MKVVFKLRKNWTWHPSGRRLCKVTDWGFERGTTNLTSNGGNINNYNWNEPAFHYLIIFFQDYITVG